MNMESRGFHALTVGALACVAILSVAQAKADSFEKDSLIVPMDTTYQDSGMFKAYGLLYKLLAAKIPVKWVIRKDKPFGGADFTASAVDVKTGAVINNHSYRGGPFVVDVVHSTEALVIVQAWQASHVTTVHKATSTFTAEVPYELVTAPTIAIFADGNEDIAFQYLNAAGIPDSLGQAWPGAKNKDSNYPGFPDVLNLDAVAGANHLDNHRDGALFDAKGNPSYCQIMTMHWNVWNSSVGNPGATAGEIRNDGAVAEIREFLSFPTHLMAECQAVNAIENSYYGRFLTPNGFVISSQPASVQFMNAAFAFAQMDGSFQTVGGSEPSFSLPSGEQYYDSNVVMVTASDSGVGVRDVWMSGFIGENCKIDPRTGEEDCTNTIGKVSYLGGHKYTVTLPMSTNPTSQGTRLFLNSLFEAPCTVASSQPVVSLAKAGPASTLNSTVTYSIEVFNEGPLVVSEVKITDVLPFGSVFVSATSGGTHVDGVVTWTQVSLGVDEVFQADITVSFGGFGTYENTASLDYRVGQKTTTVASKTVSTVYGECIPGQKRCEGLTPRQCNASGNWTDGAQCPFVCEVTTGMCTGECVPGSVGCSGLTPRTCDEAGLWIDGAACLFLCVEQTGACTGECAPYESRCIGLALEECDIDGWWQEKNICEFVCDPLASNCIGECIPGSMRCHGSTPQECDLMGSWVSGEDCPNGCTSGICNPSADTGSAPETDTARDTQSDGTSHTTPGSDTTAGYDTDQNIVRGEDSVASAGQSCSCEFVGSVSSGGWISLLVALVR